MQMAALEQMFFLLLSGMFASSASCHDTRDHFISELFYIVGPKRRHSGSNCVCVCGGDKLLFYVWGQCVMINGLQLQLMRQSSLLLAFFFMLCLNYPSDRHERNTVAG